MVTTSARIKYKHIIQNFQTLQGYIFQALQHFATKFCNFINFIMFFQMRNFGQLLLVDKQKVPYLYKTTSKEFGFLHKSYATAVSMATMTFQDSGYFDFKVI
jgi:uncharacterized protein Usg